MSAARSAIEAVERRAEPGPLAATGVDVHFQPDAVTVDGRPVLARILADGGWRTQFETRTSNGGLTAFPGGDRWGWETRLFDGAYDGAAPSERPAYGALRITPDDRGSAPRFGSAFLRLGPVVLARTTICFPDSAHRPEAVGTPGAAGAVIDALGRIVPEDPLDRYVEAHVHGGVRLEDVDAVVLDPSFRGTEVEPVTAGDVALEWHDGFVLDPADIPALSDYRGREVCEAALRIAAGEPLTPYRLGLARPALPPLVAKRVWHLLAAFGAEGSPRP